MLCTCEGESCCAVVSSSLGICYRSRTITSTLTITVTEDYLSRVAILCTVGQYCHGEISCYIVGLWYVHSCDDQTEVVYCVCSIQVLNGSRSSDTGSGSSSIVLSVDFISQAGQVCM